MLDAVLNFFFPAVCPFCREILTDKTPVCESCMKSLPFVPENCCSSCSRPLEEFSYHICSDCQKDKIYFDGSFIPLIYKDEARDCAIALKSGHPFYAKGIAYLLADKILNSPDYDKIDVITFVPQSFKGKFDRGYNQAYLIVKELSALLKIPVRSTLKRTDSGKDQHTLKRAARRENVKKCYFAKNVQGEGTALLVDDIYTTGATSNYCSRLLRSIGFKKVYIAIGFIKSDD